MKYLVGLVFMLFTSVASANILSGPTNLPNLRITVMENTNGKIVIMKIDKTSAFRRWGIHKNDVILEMNGEDVTIFDLMALGPDDKPKLKILQFGFGRSPNGEIKHHRIDLKHSIYYPPNYQECC
tara:strand:- start:18 stop:392 length:375 start_codon:yes stop_codon:yes gene_type:complete